jgi:hypothetical protein
MKNKPHHQLTMLRAGWRCAGFSRYLVGASLVVLGAQARAGDAFTPEQYFEGGTNTFKNWVEFSVGGMGGNGNENQAQRGQQHDTGPFGGIEDLHYESEIAKKTTFTLEGRSIFDEHDYSLGLGLNRENLGFLRLNFENFRTWDSGNGDYLPADGTAWSLPGDALALDRGFISLVAGLTKPNLPQITFKYTHRYRDGDKSSTLWGPVHDSTATVYRAYPGISSIDETFDTIQLDLTHHYKKINYGMGVSYEHGNLDNQNKLTFWNGEPARQKATDRQGTAYDLLNVHAFAESWLKKNLFLSTGFLFANLDSSFSGSRVYGDDFDVGYSPAYPALGYGYTDLDGGSHKNEYVVNVNLMSLPTKKLTITPSIRMQLEDWDAHSAGIGNLYDSSTGTGYQENFTSHSGRDSLDVTERLDLRYTGMTNWVFSGGGQWTEGQGSLHQNGGLTQVNGTGPAPVNFDTDESRFSQKYFASARWYPARRTSIDVGGYYKYNRYDYNFNQDSTPNDLTTGDAYPGFLVYQGFETWDGNTRVTLRLPKNITLVSRYEYQFSTISTRPDWISGLSQEESSKMRTHIFGQNANWTPLNWLGLQLGFNYVASKTETPASAYTQAILDAQNNYWTLNFNSTLVLDNKTDLNLGYFYYRAANGQNDLVGGLPLGSDAEQQSITATLTRRLTQNLRLNLKYAFSHYNDFAAAGHYNYNSHLIYSSLQYRF